MKALHDPDAIITAWLEDGPLALPDGSRRVVESSIHLTPQRRGPLAWLPWRDPTMNGNPMRVAVAAILGLLILAGGGIYLANRSSGGVGAPPVATPSPGPTPSASPASPAMLKDAPQAACGPGGGTAICVAPGTYRLSGDVWPGEITMDVPAGWFEWLPYTDRDAYDALLVNAGTDNGSGWGLEFNVVDTVPKDPCDPTKGTYDQTETSTVDGLVAAMSRWPGFKATAPIPTVVGGYSGKLVELTSTRTDTDCPSGGSVWTIPQGGSVNAYPMVGTPGKARAGTFRIVDINGTLLVIRTTEFPDTSPNELPGHPR